jgi:hypothetical protein
VVVVAVRPVDARAVLALALVVVVGELPPQPAKATPITSAMTASGTGLKVVFGIRISLFDRIDDAGSTRRGVSARFLIAETPVKRGRGYGGQERLCGCW